MTFNQDCKEGSIQGDPLQWGFVAGDRDQAQF